MRKPSRVFFVILFEGRAGSSYTVSCLNSHRDIWCYPEVLARQNGVLQTKILKGIAQGRQIEQMPQVVLNAPYFLNRSAKRTPFQAVGFKTKLQDIWQVSRFNTYLNRHRFRLIYLKRQNIIKSALSMLNAQRLVSKYGQGHWNAYQERHVQGAFYVCPDALLAQIQKCIRLEKWHQQFYDWYGQDKMQCFYEDLLADESQFMMQVLGFLDVAHQALKGRFLKNTPDQLEDAILNYEEIRDLFTNTYFERFFYPDVSVS